MKKPGVKDRVLCNATQQNLRQSPLLSSHTSSLSATKGNAWVLARSLSVNVLHSAWLLGWKPGPAPIHYYSPGVLLLHPLLLLLPLRPPVHRVQHKTCSTATRGITITSCSCKHDCHQFYALRSWIQEKNKDTVR